MTDIRGQGSGVRGQGSEVGGRKTRCIVAGGGTGGHLFPGIAVAKELEERFPGSEILFVVGRKRMESEILGRYGFRVTVIDVEGMKGRGWKKGLAVLGMIPRSLVQSMRIIKNYKPSFVIGVGGYSSGPFCLCARLMGIPTAIHEQNSYPGVTNRLLARVVDRILISFEESAPCFKHQKTILTGNPVRRELLSPPLSKPAGDFVVLVVGGSQGAKAVNEAFMEAYALLHKRGRKIAVIHQTGAYDYQRVMAAYRTEGLEAVAAPFIKDMASAYHRADMVVSRAGATTLFELAALGKPSILIPYPHAANGHQEANARCLARHGGAEIVLQQDLTGERLANILVKYMDDQEGLKRMGDAAKAFSCPDAARLIVDELVKLLAVSY